MTALNHPQVPRRTEPRAALVLMGGGARTAYQAGVLQGITSILRLQAGARAAFPFQILVGTSAGALNAAYLAGVATQGLRALELPAHFWLEMRCDDVYRLQVPPWVRVSRLLAGLRLARHARREGAVLDTMPLVNTLHCAISLPGIEAALQEGALQTLAVTASSYTTGVHWTFCHTAQDAQQASWSRPGRKADYQPITIEHLMASSAIPFLFPATPLWADGRREYFGDGSMRQVAPLSPAVHLGATAILVIGVGQPERASLAGPAVREPTLGSIAGHAMASVFHDTLQADVEQMQRVTQTVRSLPPEVAAALPHRAIDVLAIQPSQSLDAIAQKHLHALPPTVRRAMAALGGLRAGGGALASYLLFERGFTGELVNLGVQDAFARKADILAFFGDNT